MQQFLESIKRILRKLGKILIAFWANPNLELVYYFLLTIISALTLLQLLFANHFNNHFASAAS